MQANFHDNRSRVPQTLREFLVFFLNLYIYICLCNLERGQTRVELADLTRGMGVCEKTFFFRAFFLWKAGLVWWVGPGTEKEELQHLIPESHKGSAQKKNNFSDRAFFFFRNRKPGQNPAPGSQPRERIRRQNSPEARACGSVVSVSAFKFYLRALQILKVLCA